MSSWVSGVITIRRENELEPNHCSFPLVQLLQDTNYADSWMVVGELTDNAVHHTHFIIQTTKRADAVRRFLLMNQSKYSVKFDVCKIATTRYWFGMFCYLLKNPLLVYVSEPNLGDLAWTCIEQGDTLKYIDKVSTEKPKDVVAIIIQIIEEYSCKTVEDVFFHGSDKLIKYLHLSTLSNVILNCLHFYRARFSRWDPFSFIHCPDKDPRVIHNILKKQNIDIPAWDFNFWKWLTRKNGKKNTIILIGQSNTGKSVFIRGLITLLSAGSIINTSSAFFAEGICGCILAYWEEPLLTTENAEMFKLIAEGAPVQIPQKFKKPFNHQGCPLIITTNHDICRFCQNESLTISNRVTTFMFSNLLTSSSGCSASDCICLSRSERRSTPCHLNWSSSCGDSLRESTYGSSGNSRSSSSQIYRQSCGRWWCNRQQNRLCSCCSSSNFKRSDTGGPSSSSSTSISRNYRSCGRDETGSTRNRILSRNTELFIRSSEFSRTSPTSDHHRNSRSRSRSPIQLGSDGTRGDAERSRESNPECTSSSDCRILSDECDQSQTTIQVPTERQVCACITEPIPQDWQAYIAFLAFQYGT